MSGIYFETLKKNSKLKMSGIYFETFKKYILNVNVGNIFQNFL